MCIGSVFVESSPSPDRDTCHARCQQRNNCDNFSFDHFTNLCTLSVGTCDSYSADQCQGRCETGEWSCSLPGKFPLQNILFLLLRLNDLCTDETHLIYVGGSDGNYTDMAFGQEAYSMNNANIQLSPYPYDVTNGAGLIVSFYTICIVN